MRSRARTLANATGEGRRIGLGATGSSLALRDLVNQNNPQWGDGGRAGFRDEPWSDRSAASEPNEGETAEPGVQPRGMGSPISDEAYNVITALQAKLEGLEAYRKYAKDGGAGIWEQLTQIETQGVSMLVDELERIVKDGKLRGGSRIA